MEVERQLIPVKDGDAVEARLEFTRHGPVISEDTQKNVAFAVRAAWLEPGTAPTSAAWTTCAPMTGTDSCRR